MFEQPIVTPEINLQLNVNAGSCSKVSFRHWLEFLTREVEEHLKIYFEKH